MEPFTDEIAGEAKVPERALRWIIIAVEYAIILSLVLVAGVVLVHTVVDFIRSSGAFSLTVVAAIDGILVVIIVVDLAHTVFARLRTSAFPVRPFLEIGILAGVRDILSASAHLTLGGPLPQNDFNNTLISLAVGVGVVVMLLLGLYILKMSRWSTDGSIEGAGQLDN